MNGLHDVGGVDGLGPVHPTPAEPPFRAEWEKVTHSFITAGFLAGFFGLDSFRYGIELMDPREYLSSPYYLHWVRSVEHHAIAAGAIDPAELDRRTKHYLERPDAPLPEHEPNPELVGIVEAAVFAGASARRPVETPPAFLIGDAVLVDDTAPFGHTRRARYVRGKTGTVIAHRGSFVYPDSAAAGRGENPQHVYTVLFSTTTLWGEQYAEPNTSTTIDVWERYITRVVAKEEVKT